MNNYIWGYNNRYYLYFDYDNHQLVYHDDINFSENLYIPFSAIESASILDDSYVDNSRSFMDVVNDIAEAQYYEGYGAWIWGALKPGQPKTWLTNLYVEIKFFDSEIEPFPVICFNAPMDIGEDAILLESTPYADIYNQCQQNAMDIISAIQNALDYENIYLSNLPSTETEYFSDSGNIAIQINDNSQTLNINTPSITQQLKELVQLKEGGHISEEEFNILKQNIINNR